jgi:hypothetical protein
VLPLRPRFLCGFTRTHLDLPLTRFRLKTKAIWVPSGDQAM